MRTSTRISVNLLATALGIAFVAGLAQAAGFYFGSNYTASVAIGPISIDAHCSATNASSATTVACGSITPTAGDAIVCAYRYVQTSAFVSIGDATNGLYMNIVSPVEDAGFSNYKTGIALVENVSSTAVNPTLTIGTAATNNKISCKALKNTYTKYGLDGAFFAQAQGSGANPTTSSITPSNNNEFVMAVLADVSATASAGAGYTLQDNVAGLFPEHQIQTTATATNAPFTAGADTGGGWTDNLIAIAKKPASGTCDANGFFDWRSSNGTVATLVNLQANTFGGPAQSIAFTQQENGNPVGWTSSGTIGDFTYTTTGANGFANAETCPSFTGTGTATTALQYTVNSLGGTNVSAVHYTFDSAAGLVSLATCLEFDAAALTSGTFDILTIFAPVETNPSLASDFANARLDIGLQLNLETGAASYLTGPTLSANTKYWVYLQYQHSTGATTHTLKVYNGCGNNPTLLTNGTVAGAGVTNNALANYYVLGTASASIPNDLKGKHFWYADAKWDKEFGGDLKP